MGVLALYNSISNIEHADRETTLTEVKEIVDKAVAHSEKGGLKRRSALSHPEDMMRMITLSYGRKILTKEENHSESAV